MEKGSKLAQKNHNEEPVLRRHTGDLNDLDELERREARLRLAKNVRTVWGERVFLFRLLVLGFVIAFALAFLIPSRYTSTTRLMPPDNQATSTIAMAAAALTGKAGGLGEMAGELLGIKNTSDIFVGILESRTVQDALVDKFELRKEYGVKRMESARGILKSRTDVSVDRKSQILRITVVDHDPKKAAAMANEYVNQLDHLVAKLSTSSARREREFLETRLQGVNSDLESAEKEFSQFSSKNATIDMKEQGKAMVEAAATLQGRLIFAQSELESLRQVFSDENVRVRAARARVEELKSQLDKLGGQRDVSLNQSSSVTELYPSLRKLPLLGVQWADLYRRTKVQEAVFEALTQQYELAKVQEAKEIPTVKVLDPPDVPETKSFPPRLLIGLTGSLLGLLGGVSFLLASQNWKETAPDDIGKVLAQEIWIDLKENRLLKIHSGAPVIAQGNGDKKHGILAFLGLRNGVGSAQHDNVRHREEPEVKQ